MEEHAWDGCVGMGRRGKLVGFEAKIGQGRIRGVSVG